MATTLRSYIFFTFVICCVSFAILVTSVSTTSWVNAKIISFMGNVKYEINFGLFAGSLIDIFLETPKYYAIYMACIAEENICVWSCRSTVEERQEEVKNLFTVADAPNVCVINVRSAPMGHLARFREQWDAEGTTYDLSSTTEGGSFPIDQQFLNLGVWGSTLASLIICIIMSGVAAVGAVVNTAANPVHTLAAVPGLYLWNIMTDNILSFMSALKAFFALLTMILWGSHYGVTLKEHVPIRETVTGEFKVDGTTSLGFSYWLLLGSALLHAANIGILYFREVMLVRMPEPNPVNPTEENDGAIFLY